jgi:hypothetical protein
MPDRNCEVIRQAQHPIDEAKLALLGVRRYVRWTCEPPGRGPVSAISRPAWRVHPSAGASSAEGDTCRVLAANGRLGTVESHECGLPR